MEKRRELEKKARKRQFKAQTQQQEQQTTSPIPSTIPTDPNFQHTPIQSQLDPATQAAAAAADAAAAAVRNTHPQSTFTLTSPTSLPLTSPLPTTTSFPMDPSKHNNIPLNLSPPTNDLNSDRARLEQLEAQRQWRINKRREMELKRLRGASSKRGRKKAKPTPPEDTLTTTASPHTYTIPGTSPMQQQLQHHSQAHILTPTVGPVTAAELTHMHATVNVHTQAMQSHHPAQPPTSIQLAGPLPVSTAASLPLPVSMTSTRASSLQYSTHLPSTSRAHPPHTLGIYHPDVTATAAMSMPFPAASTYLHPDQPMPSAEQMDSIIPNETKLDYVDPVSAATVAHAAAVSTGIPTTQSAVATTMVDVTDIEKSVAGNTTNDAGVVPVHDDQPPNLRQVEVGGSGEQLLSSEPTEIVVASHVTPPTGTHEAQQNILEKQEGSEIPDDGSFEAKENEEEEGIAQRVENELMKERINEHEQANAAQDHETGDHGTTTKDEVATDSFQNVPTDLLRSEAWQNFDHLGNA